MPLYQGKVTFDICNLLLLFIIKTLFHESRTLEPEAEKLVALRIR